jgi:hypothetical protein
LGKYPIDRNLIFKYHQDFNIFLAGGGREQFGIEKGPITEFNGAAVFPGDAPLICVGRIIYRDNNGIIRETGFCRKFGFRPRISERIPDPDYEYAY